MQNRGASWSPQCARNSESSEIMIQERRWLTAIAAGLTVAAWSAFCGKAFAADKQRLATMTPAAVATEQSGTARVQFVNHARIYVYGDPFGGYYYPPAATYYYEPYLNVPAPGYYLAPGPTYYYPLGPPIHGHWKWRGGRWKWDD